MAGFYLMHSYDISSVINFTVMSISCQSLAIQIHSDPEHIVLTYTCNYESVSIGYCGLGVVISKAPSSSFWSSMKRSISRTFCLFRLTSASWISLVRADRCLLVCWEIVSSLPSIASMCVSCAVFIALTSVSLSTNNCKGRHSHTIMIANIIASQCWSYCINDATFTGWWVTCSGHTLFQCTELSGCKPLGADSPLSDPHEVLPPIGS